MNKLILIVLTHVCLLKHNLHENTGLYLFRSLYVHSYILSAQIILSAYINSSQVLDFCVELGLSVESVGKEV